MTNTDTIPAATEVHIRIAHDDDASRIAAVLEALGYRVMRELDEGDAPARLEWAVTRLARRHKLTRREQDILALVLEGHGNEQVGRKLQISRATVKWHMHNLFAKTNTGNRESLLRLSLQLGSSSLSLGPTPAAPAAAPARTPIVATPFASSVPVKMPATSLSISPRPATMTKRSESQWGTPEDVTSRIDFDQPRVPSAETIPSKRWV